MVKQLDHISLVERQRCANEFCVRLGKCGSETLQLFRQACGDDVMRRAAVFKWRKRFRDGETNVKGQNRLFHYPSEACGKRSAARLITADRVRQCKWQLDQPWFVILPA
jgi:hypothetical protein